jgi:hypothetical protein
MGPFRFIGAQIVNKPHEQGFLFRAGELRYFFIYFPDGVHDGFSYTKGNDDSYKIKKKTPPHPPFRWHKSFHDHIIRDERDFRNHIRYITRQPEKHGIPGRVWIAGA